MEKPKWCSYCRKDDHNDSECWCTRVVTSHPASSILPYSPGIPPFKSALSEELRVALRRAGVDITATKDKP